MKQNSLYIERRLATYVPEHYFDGLVQDSSNCIVNSLELPIKMTC